MSVFQFYMCLYTVPDIVNALSQLKLQSNLTIVNPGYNKLPDITNIDLRMYTRSYLLYVNDSEVTLIL